MDSFTLADELTLLAYDDNGSARVGAPVLDYGLAGAVLIELALADRIGMTNERVRVIDATPLGVDLLDKALARIASEDKPQTPKHWVSVLSTDVRDHVLDGLAAAGVLRRETDKVLWVFPRTRYLPADGSPVPVETEIRQRLVVAITEEGPVLARTAAVVCLLRAIKYDDQIFADLPKDRVTTRLAGISNGDWAAEATKQAIAEVEEAVMIAVMIPVIGMTVLNNNN
jgi:hypothetical protein